MAFYTDVSIPYRCCAKPNRTGRVPPRGGSGCIALTGKAAKGNGAAPVRLRPSGSPSLTQKIHIQRAAACRRKFAPPKGSNGRKRIAFPSPRPSRKFAVAPYFSSTQPMPSTFKMAGKDFTCRTLLRNVPPPMRLPFKSKTS